MKLLTFHEIWEKLNHVPSIVTWIIRKIRIFAADQQMFLWPVRCETIEQLHSEFIQKKFNVCHVWTFPNDAKTAVPYLHIMMLQEMEMKVKRLPIDYLS